MVLPVHPSPQARSGIVAELLDVLISHIDKAIFVMPPSAVWERDLKGTPLAGQLERLWTEMAAVLQRRAPSLPSLLPYRPEGCIWAHLYRYGYYQLTTYAYGPDGAAQALGEVQDHCWLTRIGSSGDDELFNIEELRQMRGR